MKVLAIITGLNKGGAEKIFSYLVSYTSLYGFDFKPIVVSILGGIYKKRLNENGIPVLVLANKKDVVNSFINIVRLLGMLLNSNNSFDIIHSFLPHAGFIGSVAKGLSGKPFFYAIRNSRTFEINERNYVKKLIRMFCDFLALRMADCICCNSPYIHTLYARKLPQKKVVTVNNAVIIDKVLDRNSIAPPFGVRLGLFNVVYIANMRSPQKDVLGALHVALLLPEFNFIFVGDGPNLQEFEMAKETLKAINCIFVGYCDMVFKYLLYADLYLLLTNHEGFPNTVLEAMIAGVPVVMSDIPEVSGILKNGENAILVENGNYNNISQIIYKIKNKTIDTSSLIKNAYECVKNEFSLESMIQNNYSMYLSIIRKNILNDKVAPCVE